MGLATKLINVLHSVVRDTNRYPGVIVMHPQTWENMIKESLGDVHGLINPHNSGVMQFNGIDVVRSLDVKEDEFKM